MSNRYKKMDDINIGCPTMYRMPFYIGDAVGNNAFSYDERQCRKIRVASLVQDEIAHARTAPEFAFVEIDERNLEQKNVGLENFIRQKNCFLFDNHNHSYYFYKQFLRENNLKLLGFLHIDQHKDMRKPSKSLAEYSGEIKSLEEEFEKLGIDALQLNRIAADYIAWVGDEEKAKSRFDEEALDFLYTNRVLNVGNFIMPLLEENRISSLAIIDSQYQMDNFSKSDFPKDYVLDLDLDFFSKDMDYISYERRLDFVCEAAKDAKAILIASSPYFISFDDAKRALDEIFETGLRGI